MKILIEEMIRFLRLAPKQSWDEDTSSWEYKMKQISLRYYVLKLGWWVLEFLLLIFVFSVINFLKNFLSKVFMKLMEYNMVRSGQNEKTDNTFQQQNSSDTFLIIWSLKICSFKYQTKEHGGWCRTNWKLLWKRKKRTHEPGAEKL